MAINADQTQIFPYRQAFLSQIATALATGQTISSQLASQGVPARKGEVDAVVAALQSVSVASLAAVLASDNEFAQAT